MAKRENSKFYPLIMNTFGDIGDRGLEYLKILSSQHNYSHSLSVSEMIERLAIIVIKGNANIIKKSIQFHLDYKSGANT